MITVGMIVRDAAKTLAPCLLSVLGLADEIVVVDTGSADGTVPVAQEFGARVVHHRWKDSFAEARNVYLREARYPWILVLDADEALAPGAADVIRGALASAPDDDPPTLFYLPVRSWTSDDRNDAHAMETYLPRLLPNHPALRYFGVIHENPALSTGAPFRSRMIPATLRHDGYRLSGEERRRKGKRNDDLIRKALREEPDDPFHHFNHGFSLFSEDRFTEALAAFARASRLLGAHHRAAYWPQMTVLTAISLVNTGRPDEALRSLEGVRNAHPDFADASFVEGRIHLMRGRRDEAKRSFGDALAAEKREKTYFGLRDLSTASWKPLLELAQLSFGDGDYGGALARYEEALRHLPGNGLILADMASCHAKSGAAARALELWGEALPGGFATADAAVEYLEALIEAGAPAQGSRAYGALGEKFPDAFAVHLAGGRLLAAQGLRDEARHAFGRALELRPGDAVAKANLAALLMEMGLAREALELLAT